MMKSWRKRRKAEEWDFLRYQGSGTQCRDTLGHTVWIESPDYVVLSKLPLVPNNAWYRTLAELAV